MIHKGTPRCLCGFFVLSLALNLLFGTPAFAHDAARESSLNASKALLTEHYPEAVALAEHPQWLALLHFKVSPRGDFAHSYVTTPTYFLSANGHNDPAAELHATLNAFNAAPTSSQDEHALCRFPARKLWLEANTPYTFSTLADQMPCTEFNDWAELDEVESLSMVFATGHFSSPASFFGHNFLKINKQNSSDYLLDTAINFGALIPPEHGPIPYLANGIFGGYEAEYKAEPFYRFLAKYGEKDLRDVWEYKLSLNAQQRDLLIAHLWELREIHFSYYFFRENCAYQISALLNIITDTLFVPRYLPWAMPITVFDKMMSADINGQPLIEDIQLHRSRRTLFQNRFAASQTKVKNIIHRFALGQFDIEQSDAYQALSEDEKIGLIDTLLDYSAFMAKEKDGEAFKENQRKLLLIRLGLKQSAAYKPKADQSNPPHLGQKPSYTALGISHSEHNNTKGFLHLRPAYFDFLSLEIGRKAHASFTLFDTSFHFGDGIALRRFDLATLSNLNTQYSGIALDKAASWQLRIGYEPVSDTCTDCNGWLVQWDRGKSKKIGKHLAAFALAGVALKESRNRTANGEIIAQIGITGRLTPHWQLYAKASYTESFNRFQPFHTSLEIENRFGNSRWWDVRLKAEQRDELVTTLSAALYW